MLPSAVPLLQYMSCIHSHKMLSYVPLLTLVSPTRILFLKPACVCWQVYPVDRHLVSIWSPFYPKSLAITAIKKCARRSPSSLACHHPGHTLQRQMRLEVCLQSAWPLAVAWRLTFGSSLGLL